MGNSGGKSYPDQLEQMLGSRYYEVKNFGVSGSAAQNNAHDQSPVGETAHFGYRTAELFPITPDWMDNSRVVIDSGVDLNGNPVTVDKFWDAGTGKYWAKEYTVYQQSQLYRADVYIISMGGNDAKPCNQGEDNTFEQDYVDLIREYCDLPWHPLVIVSTSPAMVEGTVVSKTMDEVIVPYQRKAIAELGLPMVDSYGAIVVGRDRFFIEDGEHLNDAGYEAVAKSDETGGAKHAGAVERIQCGQRRQPHCNGRGDRPVGEHRVADGAAGVNINALTPALSLEPGATYTPSGAQNFIRPVTYTSPARTVPPAPTK